MATGLNEFSSPNANVDPILLGNYNESNYAFLNEGLKAYKSDQREILWDRNIAESDGSYYGDDLQSVDESQTINEENVCETRELCNLCGENTIYGVIHGKDDLISLCTTCLNHIESFANWTIKESIERFLIGNVI